MDAPPHIPPTMRSLVAHGYCKPDQYEIIDLPVPVIEEPDDVLIQVHAAAVQTGDTMFTNKATRMIGKVEFPLKIGNNGGGIVVAVGSEVKSVKVGDAVYGVHFAPPLLPMKRPAGACSEFMITKEALVLPKPLHVSFEDAVATLGSAVTAYQCVRKGLEMMGQPNGTLEGKTVFMPAALSATGSVGAQMMKNVFGASGIVSTVSTPKVRLVDQYLPGIVDKVIDYKTQDVVREAGKGSADFIYNTTSGMVGLLPIAKRGTGVVVSIASVPPPDILQRLLGAANVPFWVVWILQLAQLWYRLMLAGTGVQATFVSGSMLVREDLEAVGEMIATGKIKAVATVVDFYDIEAVRAGCTQVGTGKGGLGKLVLKIIQVRQ